MAGENKERDVGMERKWKSRDGKEMEKQVVEKTMFLA